MEKEQDTFRALEGFRTDYIAKPKPSTVRDEKTAFWHRSWMEKVTKWVVVLVMISVSVTVYAYTSEEPEPIKQSGQKQANQSQKKQDVLSGQEKPTSKSDEAQHLQYTEKNVSSKLDVKITKKRRKPTQSKQPPQPNTKEKPAKNDQPMRMPEHLEKKVAKGSTLPSPKKKKP